MLFRSNDTATTEIYTVMNTLSLHDALPILDDLSVSVRIFAVFVLKIPEVIGHRDFHRFASRIVHGSVVLLHTL